MTTNFNHQRYYISSYGELLPQKDVVDKGKSEAGSVKRLPESFYS